MWATLRKSFYLALCLLLLLTVILAGCGGDDDDGDDKKSEKTLKPATLQLNFFPDPEFVGYYVAASKGFYEDEGVDLELLAFDDSMVMSQVVIDGTADFTILGTGDIKAAISADVQPVAIMALFQISPLVLFAKADSGILTPQDMVGKRVAIKAEGWRSIINSVLENAGVDPADVIAIDVSTNPSDMEKFYQDEVDVWSGFATSEPVMAQTNGFDVNVIYTTNYGVGTYEGIVVVRQALIDEQPDVVQGFVTATIRGWEYAFEHPDEAATIMLEYQPDQSVEFHRAATLTIQPLIDAGVHPIGWIDQERWELELEDLYNPEQPAYSTTYVEAAQ